MKIHKQTAYILQDEQGNLSIFQYSSDSNQAGQSDRDQYACMIGLFIDNPTHDLWLGKVKCHRNQSASWGINTVKGLTCKIVAKKSFLWDMTKPIGERMSEVKQTSNFETLLKDIVKAKYHHPRTV